MASVNKVILIGNLGKDPELRYTPGKSAVTSFPLATTDRWNDKGGQRQEKTEWHNIVVWGKQAETAHQYLKKGRPAYIEGRLTTRSWDDRDGNKRYRTEIVANVIQFLGGGGGAGGGSLSAGPMAEESISAAPAGSEDFTAAESVPESAPVEDDLPF